MNLCKVLVSKSDKILITFEVTEEWLSFIGTDEKCGNVRLRSIPNFVPSEQVRASDMVGFLEAVWTKMEAPFEKLLNELELPPTLIIADTHLFWANEQVDYIPGVSSTRLLDLPDFNGGIYPLILKQILGCVSSVRKADYLLFPSIYELESRTIDALKAELSLFIYAVGPCIPYLNLIPCDRAYCLQWLDRQPCNSALYVSMGSFLSVSSAQMEEITAGLRGSGVRFLLVAREGISDGCGDKGLVVPWCDQLRVLCHGSIGGFWSHCGWNSVREGVFAGTPFLTFPLLADQNLNSKLIVEDWKIGWRMKQHGSVTTRDHISDLAKTLMDSESDDEVQRMRRRARELREKCLKATGRHGSSETNISSFLDNILQCNPIAF
ncbi:UDP-glycosyltransferase 87A1-like [Hibiscus syriacus]|uniref:UDP-glycosyltransferase 87A1-like n=1 Tax=Hibiscus syriacus TaxID=106335 RepID=A0A6A2WYC0_HIBSY|nr:UDP-glycosyltransferase 87A1-like [Hibiscus syriacus]